VLDLGTGTGCLLLAALSEYPGAWGLGIEIHPEAAALARRNAGSSGLDGRCAMMCGDWDAALGDGGPPFDVVLSNPPYIPIGEVDGLMPEVARYEPSRALAAGEDGLDAYRRIVRLLPARLAPSGIAILEMGVGQVDAVSALAAAAGLREAGRRRDLGGIARALLLERR